MTAPPVDAPSKVVAARQSSSSTLPAGTGRSPEAGVWMVPATVGAAIAVGLTLRVLVPELRYEIAFIGLGLMLAAMAGVRVVAHLLGRRS